MNENVKKLEKNLFGDLFDWIDKEPKPKEFSVEDERKQYAKELGIDLDELEESLVGDLYKWDYKAKERELLKELGIGD
ncbi:MAG: hypothetical protein LBN30_00230 [Oscillospiraceae bacterium]|jgi:hypothetical protein|nr:hypothetical protein [Oscillospiraceae bacterium]